MDERFYKSLSEKQLIKLKETLMSILRELPEVGNAASARIPFMVEEIDRVLRFDHDHRPT